MHIAGKVAIVTGGARGLGKAFSEAILARGGKVCLADIDTSQGEETLAELKKKYGGNSCIFVKCDVTSDSDFKALFRAAKEKFHQIHIVVNNAGISDEVAWEKTIEIDLTAMMRGTYLAVENMRKDNGGEGGLVLNVSSAAGLNPVFFMPAYVAAKYGVVGFTRSWAGNPYCKEYGISFACLCPAFTDTEMFAKGISENNPGVLNQEFRQQRLALVIRLGVNSVETVRDAFVDLVEKEGNNGAVVRVEKLRGVQNMFTNPKSRI